MKPKFLCQKYLQSTFLFQNQLRFLLNFHKHQLIYFHKQQILELYDLSKDIEEQHDLSSIEHAKTKALAHLLTQKLKDRGAAMPSWLSNGQTIAWPNEIFELSNANKVVK